MALIVEDGTIVEDADTYASRAELIAYAAKRGVVIADDDASDVFLVKAMDKLAIACFRGLVVSDAQALPFPRVIRDAFSGELLYPIDAIPAGLKKAQLEYALAVSQGVDLVPTLTTEANVKREKVGPLETEYFDGVRTSATVPGAEAALAPFTCGHSFSLTVVRV